MSVYASSWMCAVAHGNHRHLLRRARLQFQGESSLSLSESFCWGSASFVGGGESCCGPPPPSNASGGAASQTTFTVLTNDRCPFPSLSSSLRLAGDRHRAEQGSGGGRGY
jgi:hypothetical protein